MTYVIVKDKVARQVTGDPTLKSLDGETNARFSSIISEGWPEGFMESFGVFKVDTEPRKGLIWGGGFEVVKGVPVAAFVGEPTPEEILSEKRSAASAERADFCNRLADIDMLTNEEAIDAAKGAWPAPMQDFLAVLDDRQRRDVLIEWATRLTVERMHWAVLLMVSLGFATEEQADYLCGAIDSPPKEPEAQRKAK